MPIRSRRVRVAMELATTIGAETPTAPV